MLIYRLTSALAAEKVDYAIAGGWAVALHGAVRGTVDIDIVINLSRTNLQRVERALQSIGLQSRLPISADDVFRFREEYIKNKKMLAWRFVNPANPTEIVDLLIHENLEGLRRKNIAIGGKKIPLVSILDLIRMKRKSGRPQDLEDIKALEMLKK